MAASRRAPSAAQSAAMILCRVMTGAGSEARNTGPIATPAETGIPLNRTSDRAWSDRAPLRRLCCGGGGLALFIEAGLDQRGEGIEGFLGVPPFGAQFDDRAHARPQHHQAHDRTCRH